MFEFAPLSKLFAAVGQEWKVEIPLVEVCGEEETVKKVTVVVEARKPTKCIFCATGKTTDSVRALMEESSLRDITLLPTKTGDPFISETFTGWREFGFEGEFGVFDATVFVCSDDAETKVQVFTARGLTCQETVDVKVLTQQQTFPALRGHHQQQALLSEREHEERRLTEALGGPRKKHRGEGKK